MAIHLIPMLAVAACKMFMEKQKRRSGSVCAKCGGRPEIVMDQCCGRSMCERCLNNSVRTRWLGGTYFDCVCGTRYESK